MIRNLLLRSAVWLARLLYAPLKLLPVRKKIVLISRQRNTPSRDFRLLKAEWHTRHPEYEVTILCNTFGSSPLERLSYLGIIIRQMYHLATSQICVLDGYIIPASVLSHRPGLTIIQMWHALGAIKKFGYQSLDRPEGRPSQLAKTLRMHYNYDFVICGGEASVPIFSEAFGVPTSRVLPLGLPRIDYLLAHTKGNRRHVNPQSLAQLIEKNPVLLDSSAVKILYAPTFHDGVTQGFRFVTECFQDRPHTLIVKPHDLDLSFTSPANIVDATGVSVLTLLPLVDIVITDYSAVAFEAAVIGKPVYFFVPDINDYEKRHGLNFNPLTTLPSISSSDITTIARWIDESTYDRAAFELAVTPFLPSPVKGATKRIADLIEAQLLSKGNL